MRSIKIAKFAQRLLLIMAIVGVVCGSSMVVSATTTQEAMIPERVEVSEEISELEEVAVEETLEGTEAASGTWGDIAWNYTNGVLTLNSATQYKEYMEAPESAPSSYSSMATCELVAADYPWAAYRDSITQIVIGNGVASISDVAFYNMTKLEEITLSVNISKIGTCAFGNCTSLEKITLPAKLKASGLGEGVFYNCTSLTEVTGNVLLSEYIFYGCTALESIVLPESIKTIPNYAFANCSALKDITIPEMVYVIGDYAFAYCTGITNITTSSNCYIHIYAFTGCTGLYEVTVGQTVNSYAFKDCTGLTKVNFQEEVCSVGKGAFYNCTSLTEVIGNCWSLGDYAFYGCTGLTKVVFGSKLTTIGDYVFANCGLQEVWLNDVKFVMSGAKILEGNPNCKVYGKLDSDADRLANYNNCTFVPTDKLPQTTMSTLSSALNGIRVTWEEGEYALTYDVYRSTLVGGNYTLLKSGVRGTEYIDTTVTPGATYYYKVIAVGELAKSDYSEASEGGMYLKAPTFKKMVNVVSGIHVYWNASDGAKTYSIYRATSKTGEYVLVKEGLTATHFIDTAVASGNTYYYKVLGVNGMYVTSENVEPFKPYTYVGTPDITSRINKAAGIQLGWNKIAGATGYAIYRKPYEGGAWARIATISGNQTFTYTDTTVKGSNGTIYKYTIRALAGSDMKTLSGCRNTGRTMVRLSSRILNSATKASATSIKCNWTTSSAVTGYEVRFMVGSYVYRTYTVGNYKTGVKTFTGLPSGNTYKIQVRAYKKVEGVGSFYSAWSTAKTVSL